MKLEESIRQLLEAKKETKKEIAADKKEEAKEKADSVENDDPAVSIENPMNPALASSEEDEDGEKAANADSEDQTGSDDEDDEKEKADKDDKKKVDESISASIKDLLGEEFSDDFKLKAATIFEAAVKQQVQLIEQKYEVQYSETVAKLEEDFQSKVDVKTAELTEMAGEKIDGYLDYLVEEWTKHNEIALEQAVKTELTESFITNLKSLFEDHYVDLPESKVDLYQAALNEKTALEKTLSESVSAVSELTDKLNKVTRENIIKESVKDLSSLDASRFNALVEDFEFEDATTFTKKVDIVKGSFFSHGKSQGKEQLQEDLTKTKQVVEVKESLVEEVQVMNPAMAAYVSALKKR